MLFVATTWGSIHLKLCNIMQRIILQTCLNIQ